MAAKKTAVQLTVARQIDMAVEAAVAELRSIQNIYLQSNVGIRSVAPHECGAAMEAAGRLMDLGHQLMRLTSEPI